MAILVPSSRILISIHAPLAGRDDGPVELVDDPDNISIHAPLAGCDCDFPARVSDFDNFNPRTPCGVRQMQS